MSLRTHLTAIVIAAALVGHASAQQPTKPDASVHKLRNAAAADAATTLTAFADSNKLAATVIAEPVSNSVVIAGDPASHKQLVEMLAKIDTAPPQVLVQLMFMEVPAGFAEDIGLGEGSETKWMLTAREARMFTAALCAAKERGGLDILSRPQLQLRDNESGCAEIAGEANLTLPPKPLPDINPLALRATRSDTCLITRVTPRINPEGKILLRVEAQRMTPKSRDVQNVQVTELIPNGGTMIVRGGRTKTADGGSREMFVVVTPHLVR